MIKNPENTRKIAKKYPKILGFYGFLGIPVALWRPVSPAQARKGPYFGQILKFLIKITCFFSFSSKNDAESFRNFIKIQLDPKRANSRAVLKRLSAGMPSAPTVLDLEAADVDSDMD